MKGYIYIVGSAIFTLYGQLIIKWRIGKLGSIPESINGKINFLFNLFLDPFILSGFFSAFIASLFWMLAVAKYELSSAYPLMVGFTLLIGNSIAIIIFRESINIYKIMGILFIIVGLFLISKKI